MQSEIQKIAKITASIKMSTVCLQNTELLEGIQSGDNFVSPCADPVPAQGLARSGAIFFFIYERVIFSRYLFKTHKLFSSKIF